MTDAIHRTPKKTVAKFLLWRMHVFNATYNQLRIIDDVDKLHQVLNINDRFKVRLAMKHLAEWLAINQAHTTQKLTSTKLTLLILSVD